jgi:hypothetical protein
MEENIIPEHVINRFLNKNSNYPNIVRTRNITLDGINVLIEKNNLEWTNSIYDKGYTYIEGLVVWGKSKTFIYFKKNENELTYKIHILTEDISKIDMLLIGLNKYYTIDKI